jgi:hypothetical protein
MRARLICAFLYYAVLAPYALVLRAFGVRFLETRRDARSSYWTPRPPRDPAETARRLY